MEKIELGLDVAAKLTGKTVDELTALLDGKEQKEASTLFADATAQNFAELRKKVTEDMYKRGIKKKGEAIESELSGLFEKYGIADFDTAEQGISLLAEKLEQQEKPGTPDLSNLTPEQLSELPAWKSQTEKLRKVSDALKAKEQEFEDYKTTQHRQTVDAAWLSSTISTLQKEKANTGNASSEAAAKMFLASIPANRRGLDDQGRPIPLDQNGQPMTDDYGQPVDHVSFVKNNYAFGFHVADPDKGGSGSGGDGSGTGGSASIKIRSQEQGEAMIRAAMEANDQKRAAEARKALSNFMRQQKQE